MASAQEIVNQVYRKAEEYAQKAQDQLGSFTNALNASIYTPATVSFKWETPAAPPIRAIPDAPELPEVKFEPTNLMARPAPFSAAVPDLGITRFELDELTIHIPDAPTLTYGVIPTIPTIRDVSTPDAPVVVMPDLPTYMEVGTVHFAGVNLREDWLDGLEQRPTLELLEPTPYKYIAGEKYASALLEQLQAVIARRLKGGTGLAPAVEQAIWDRGRSRETHIALAKSRELQRMADGAGFPLPTGALVVGLQQVNKEYYDQLSTLSRDVSIKQAEMEQENMRQSVAEGMQLESKLIDYSYQMEQMAFESAKAAAQNAIELHNAAIQKFNGLLQGYQTYASVYKTIIDGQLAKVEVFKAQLQAEMSKAEINKLRVEQFKAEIEARMSTVEIFKAQVGAAQTLVEIEKAKISAAGEQVRGYVAQVNAETAKIEAFKAQVQGEATKAEVYKAKASAYASQVGAEAELARAHLARFQAQITAKNQEWGAYESSMRAEGMRLDAVARQSGAMLDGYRAETAAAMAEAQSQLAHWQAVVSQYSAGVQGALQTARINNDATNSANAARLEAAKAGTQVYAQLTSSAYSMMNVSAGISGSATMSVGYSYGGEVASSVPPITSIG